MTHNTVSLEPENYGSQDAYLHHINITSLDAAGSESYDPSTELSVNLGDDLGVMPVGQDDRSYIYAWNSSQNALNVTSISDGSEASNNAATGEVRLLIVGGGT